MQNGGCSALLRAYECLGVALDVGIAGTSKRVIHRAAVQTDSGVSLYQTHIAAAVNLANLAVSEVYGGVASDCSVQTAAKHLEYLALLIALFLYVNGCVATYLSS